MGTTRIIAKGALNEGTGLGDLDPLYQWFRDPDALYRFKDGAIDAAWGGTARDESANGNDATPMGGSTAPIRRDDGLEATSANGLAVLTPFAWQGDFTVIVGGWQTVGNGPAMGFPTFFGCSQGMGADLSLSNPRNHGLFIDLNINTGDSATKPLQLGIKGATNFNSGVSRRFITDNGATKQSPFVVALCVDQTSKTIRLIGESDRLDLPGETAVCAAIAAATGYFAFGVFKAGSTAVAGGVSVGAVWLGQGDMSDANVAFNLQAARIRLDGYNTADDSLAGASLPANIVLALAAKANRNLDNVTSPGAIGTGAMVSGTATAGQTTIAMSHIVPAGKEWWVELYIGGVRQRPGLDYTCNGTTTMTLAAMGLGETWWVLHRLGPA